MKRWIKTVGCITFAMAAQVGSAQVLAPSSTGPGDATDQFIVKYAERSRSSQALDFRDLQALQGLASTGGFNARHLRKTAGGAHVFKLDRFSARDAVY